MVEPTEDQIRRLYIMVENIVLDNFWHQSFGDPNVQKIYETLLMDISKLQTNGST